MILVLIFTVMLSKSIAIASYIIYSINIISYCYLIIAFILIDKVKCLFAKAKFIFFLLFFSLICGNFAISLNYSFYTKYKIICPFTMKDINLKSHLKRRCEFYNLNSNSRYSYQYICSYNPKDDFKKLILTKDEYDEENKLELIRCILVKNLLNDNNIINEFDKEYDDIDKYYCSLIYEPKKNNYINYKECDKNRFNIYALALPLNFIQLVFAFIFLSACRKMENNNIRIERDDRPDVIERLFSLNRMLILLRELLNVNIANMNNSNISTEKTEVDNNNEEDFDDEKTKNIIIYNNTSFEVNTNIDRLYNENKKEVDKNSISLDQINLHINSDDVLMKQNFDSDKKDS